MNAQNLKEQFDDVIVQVVNECREQNDIVNLVIRDDVFKILDSHCKVIYYPLENENINGFHITRMVCNETLHFVYLNTWNTLERQAFTAAHELGHIWGAYSKVKQKFPEIDDYVKINSDDPPEEFVANKFAAQLLMPYDQFTDAVKDALNDIDYNGKSISKINLLRLIAKLMDTFLVDYKAVTRRLNEIGRLRPDVYDIVQKYEDSADFEKTFSNILKEGGHSRLNRRTEDRNISDLTDIIRKAEKKDCLLLSTIELLKEEFLISTTELLDKDSEVVF